jgi:hypothetical protein
LGLDALGCIHESIGVQEGNNETGKKQKSSEEVKFDSKSDEEKLIDKFHDSTAHHYEMEGAPCLVGFYSTIQHTWQKPTTKTKHKKQFIFSATAIMSSTLDNQMKV